MHVIRRSSHQQFILACLFSLAMPCLFYISLCNLPVKLKKMSQYARKDLLLLPFYHNLKNVLSQQQDIRRYYGCHYVSHCDFVFHAFLIFFSYSNFVLCTHDPPPPPPKKNKKSQLSTLILLTSVLLFAHSGNISFNHDQTHH